MFKINNQPQLLSFKDEHGKKVRDALGFVSIGEVPFSRATLFNFQNRRNWNILNIAEERRKIRPNVEALMNEFKIRTSGGKLKVRGLFKTTLFAFNTGIAINFGRVYRFIAQNGLTNGFDQSTGVILQNVKLNLSHLWHKTEIFVCDFFSRLIFGEYFTPRVIIRANIISETNF